MSNQPMQVVVRALSVLTALRATHSGKSLQQLHEELDIPIGSLHRMLATLTQTGFVTRSIANGRYFLGREARALSSAPVSPSAQLIVPPKPLQEASEDSGETVFLTELIGDNPICVAISESPLHNLRLFVHVGQEMPLHAAAASRSILAYQAESYVRTLLSGADLTAFTAGTPRTIGQVLHLLEKIRARGWDECDNELDDGVWAVAAPVFAADGRVYASVTMAAAAGRMDDLAIREQARTTVMRAARALSLELGWDDPAQSENPDTGGHDGTLP